MSVVLLRDMLSVPNKMVVGREWQRRLTSADHIEVDLRERSSGVSQPSRVRIDPLQASILANLLAGTFSDVPLTFRLPETATLRRAFSRTPLFSAVARRTTATEDQPLLRDWTAIWSPSDLSQWHSMVEASDAPDLSPCQKKLLTLVNPHQRPRSRVALETRSLIDPWLNRRFVPAVRSAAHVEGLRSVERVMTELTENVADHAFLEPVGRTPVSSAQIYTTRGGRNSMDRFVISVCDNGCGIPRAIRRVRSDLNGIAAVRAACEGRLQHVAGRGWGLYNVAEIVARLPNSKMTLLTSHLEDRQRAVIARMDDHGLSVDDVFDLPVQGTIVLVQVALRRLASRHPELFDGAGDATQLPKDT